MNLLPFDPAQWSRLCFGGLDAGGEYEPQSAPHNAREALDAMPPGTRFRVIAREVPPSPSGASASPLLALQVSDASHSGRLGHERELYPTLWARFDADAPPADLTSYTRLLSYRTLELAGRATRTRLEVVVLVTPTNTPLQASELPLVSRRV